jgi:hypothetical protein
MQVNFRVRKGLAALCTGINAEQSSPSRDGCHWNEAPGGGVSLPLARHCSGLRGSLGTEKSLFPDGWIIDLLAVHALKRLIRRGGGSGYSPASKHLHLYGRLLDQVFDEEKRLLLVAPF